MSNILDTVSVTKEVVRRIDGLSIEDYDPENKRYCHPLDCRQGKHNNYYNPNSGFIPENCTHTIKSHEDGVIAGIAYVSEKTAWNFYQWQKEEYSNSGIPTNSEMIGIIEHITQRSGLGAKAEELVQQKLRDKANASILPQEPQDEYNRVDIRTNQYLIQVKYGKKYNNDWKHPKINEKWKQSALVWVDNKGIIRKHLKNGKRGMDKYGIFLE
jgi:hypothetical protein